MKKIILVAMGISFTVAGFAQFTFGVQAIGNAGNARIKNAEVTSFSKSAKVLPGIGVVAQYELSDKLAIRSGINYIQQGVVVEALLDPTVNLRAKAENKLQYLQLPVNVVYSIPVGNIKLYAGAGGYINYGLSGNSTLTTRYIMPDGNESVTIEKIKPFKKEEQDGAGLKRVDFGASAVAGIKLNNGLFANVGYQYGLKNISSGEGKYNNRGLQLSVGYFF